MGIAPPAPLGGEVVHPVALLAIIEVVAQILRVALLAPRLFGRRDGEENFFGDCGGEAVGVAHV